MNLGEGRYLSRWRRFQRVLPADSPGRGWWCSNLAGAIRHDSARFQIISYGGA